MIYSVSGSRSLENQVYKIENILTKYIKHGDIVITGGAKGVDKITENWCKRHDIICLVCLPVHKLVNIPYNRLFYLARDKQMVDMSQIHLNIWDGISTGTKYTLDYAKSKNKKTIEYII